MVQGIGFGWLPRQVVEERRLPLRALNLQQDNTRTYPLYLVHRDPDNMGPAARLLIDLFCQNTTGS